MALPIEGEVTETAEESANAEAAEEQVSGTEVTDQEKQDLADIYQEEDNTTPEAVQDSAEPEAEEEAAKTGSAFPAVAGDVVDPLAALAAMGFDDIELDWTSFPTVVIDDGVFSTQQAKDFSDILEFKIVDKRHQYLFAGQKLKDGREVGDPELVYSADGKITNNGEDLNETLSEWKEQGFTVNKTKYIIVTVMMDNTQYAGQMIQLQIPPTSRGVFNGHLVNMALKGFNPKEATTTAVVGEEVGSGVRTFSPWNFTF
jgi:hypothetical protein